MFFGTSFSQVLIVLLPIILTLSLLRILKPFLPVDRGRAFAIGSEKSKGKPTGAGIALFFSFAVCILILGEDTLMWSAYLVVIMLEMITGFLDDRSDMAWGEIKKGTLDLGLCVVFAGLFNYFGGLNLDFIIFEIESTSIFGYIAISVFLWLCINSYNCCDGIDGLSGSLAVNSLIFIGIFSAYIKVGQVQSVVIIILSVILLVYLWFNSEDSTLLMGDAGSRFIGLLIGVLILSTGNLWISLFFAFSIILDGFPGLIKVLIIKVFKKNVIGVRLPLHDYLRKDRNMNSSKIVVRLNLMQALMSVLMLIAYGVF